jgi:hypothetical protein
MPSRHPGIPDSVPQDLRWCKTNHLASSAVLGPVSTKEVLLLQQGCRYLHRRERRGLSNGSGIVREITAEELEHAFVPTRSAASVLRR